MAEDGLMCGDTLSVGWRGEVYDCDFNQQLGMQWKSGRPLYLWDLDPDGIKDRAIALGRPWLWMHCRTRLFL
jgi:hypothetical protein